MGIIPRRIRKKIAEGSVAPGSGVKKLLPAFLYGSSLFKNARKENAVKKARILLPLLILLLVFSSFLLPPLSASAADPQIVSTLSADATPLERALYSALMAEEENVDLLSFRTDSATVAVKQLTSSQAA